MSTGESDPSLLAKIASGMGVALAAIGTWAWQHTHSRIKDVDMKADTKASAEEVDRHRDRITKLFDKLEELDGKTSARFTIIESKAVERHIELLNAIHKLKK